MRGSPDGSHGDDGRQKHSDSPVRDFLGGVYGPDLHTKRINALSAAALGVMTGASPAVATIGPTLALARGLTTRHAIQQVDRLMSSHEIRLY